MCVCMCVCVCVCGWWLVTHDGKEGWAPASYLEPAGKCVPQDDKETDQGVFNSLHSNNA